MKFKAKKVYGNSRQESCPFCGKIATALSEQGVTVCQLHRHEKLADIKCSCGNVLEQRTGRFGPYFNCFRCGNFNFKKGMNLIQDQSSPSCIPKEKKETTITSRDVDYF